ncbi:MAG: thioredoxin family protein [Bacteroidota bacterium]|nr:thioredoxin family protein [Bacteroidota bacterium]MDP4253384.1 thioredoxin family protein [Bacteroidota bacterium]
MKKFPILFVLCFPLLSLAQGVEFASGLGFDQACEKAKAEGKSIFVDVYASWCGPCKMMDRDVYTSGQVAAEMKDKFIALKIQADSSSQDDAETRNGYANARRFVGKYKVTAYPTLLFFNPDGQLIEQELGYRSPDDFIKLIHHSLEPATAKLYGNLDAYRQGKADYPSMGKLALFVKKVLHNKPLADSIAHDYKINFLDKSSGEELCSKDNIEFIAEFSGLVRSDDGFFKLCYDHPGKVDSLIGRRGWAMSEVGSTIMRERLTTPFVQNGHPVVKNPGWESVERGIVKDYPKVKARALMLQFQLYYYRAIDLDWKVWAKYIDEQLRLDPPIKKGNMFATAFGRLNLPAWDVFQHCNDREVLKTALRWSDASIKMDQGTDDVIQSLDTRANLLHKLGRTEEAIAQEKAAVALSASIAKRTGQPEAKGPFMSDFLANLDKMQQGKPTW